MAKGLIFCAQCGFGVFIENGAIARAQRAGLRLFCGRECSGLARRKGKTGDQKRAEKAAYDARRRVELADRIRAEKAAYYQRTRDPVKEAALRKERMPRHVEYCRRPEYKNWKRQYDRKHRAMKDFGPFWEAAILVEDLQNEVLSRASRYEIDLQNGKLNKATNRKRDYVKSVGG